MSRHTLYSPHRRNAQKKPTSDRRINEACSAKGYAPAWVGAKSSQKKKFIWP
jgi:hypothetical protein